MDRRILRNNQRARFSDAPYDDSHIYVNVDIDYNAGYIASEDSSYAQTRLSKSVPIVEQAENYHLIVDRFEINGRMIPLFIWDPTKTYTVRIVDSAGTNFDVNLVYVNNMGLSPSEIGYYYVYTFNHMVDIINTALATAATAANVSVPWVVWDSTSERFRVYGLSSEYDQTAVVNPVRIGFSTEIYKLYPAFTYDHVKGSNFYLIRMYERYNNIVYWKDPTGGGAALGIIPTLLPTADDNYIFVEDEFSVVDKWSSIDSILFVSNTISLKETFTTIASSNPDSTNASTLSILTDFKLDGANSGDCRKTLIYNPAQYRLLDLYSSKPITSIDISVFFTDKNSNKLNPIRLFNGDKISIKLLFQKKEEF